MVADYQETTDFLNCANRVHRHWLFIYDFEVLTELANSVVYEDVDVKIAVLILSFWVAIKRLTRLYSVLVENTVSNVAKCVIDYDWRS